MMRAGSAGFAGSLLLAVFSLGLFSCAPGKLPQPAQVRSASPEELATLRSSLQARLDSEHRNAQALWLLALVLQKLGQLEEAENAALEASQIAPFRADLRVTLGDIQNAGGKRFRALLSYTQAVRQDPQYLDAYVKIASLQRKLGDSDKAKAALEQAIAIEPKFYDARVELAELLLERSDPIGAQAQIEAAREVQPKSPDAAHLHVRILKAQGNLGEAQAIVESWLQSSPDQPEWWREQLRLNRQRGYWEQVQAVLERLETLGGLAVSDLVVKAEWLDARGDRAAAAALRADLLKRYPEDAAVLVAAARGLLAENRPLEALAPLERAVQLASSTVETPYPNNIEAHYWRAVALYRLGRRVEADLALNRAEAVSAAFPPVRLLRIRRLLLDRRLSEAAPLMKAFLEANPGDREGLLLQAGIYSLAGDFLAAERMLDGLPAQSAAVRFARARLAFLQENFLTVLDETAPLTALAKPPWEAAYLEIAALGRLGRGGEALDKIKPWLDRDEGAPAFHRLAASIQLQAADLKGAERTLIQGTRRFPRDPVLTEGLSRIQIDRENWREARLWLEAGVEKESPLLPVLLDRLVLVYRKLGENDKARQTQLRQQSVIDPLNRELLEREDPPVLYQMTMDPLDLALPVPKK